MWTTIQGTLINLNNVIEIEKNPIKNSIDLRYVVSSNLDTSWNRVFEYKTQEEREQEFDRLIRLLLSGIYISY